MLNDDLCLSVIKKYPNARIAWWIIAAYAYDQLDDPVISDDLFDKLAIDIDRDWDIITHPHKHLLDRSSLKSSIAIQGKWPEMAKGAARNLLTKKPEPSINKGQLPI